MGKTVFITGASQGIGATMAKVFAKAGYDIAIGCYAQGNVPQGEEVAKACRENGVKAQCFVGDVSDFDVCEVLVREVAEAFGGIDVLINNAGITKDGLVVKMKEQDFDAVIAVNLKSVFNMTRHVTPLMMKKKAGKIINMSSAVGVNGNRGQVNYAASKAGIIGITKSIAKELGSRNITCNAIAPGFIESSMSGELPEKAQQAILDATALGRFGTAQDVAETALFLASSNFITGQVIMVDGGLVM